MFRLTSAWIQELSRVLDRRSVWEMISIRLSIMTEIQRHFIFGIKFTEN